MSDGAYADYDGAELASGNLRLLASRAAPGIVILASSVALGVWMVYLRPAQPPVEPMETAVLQSSTSQVVAPGPFGALAALNAGGSRAVTSQSLRDSASVIVPPFAVAFPASPYGALAVLRFKVANEISSLALDLEAGLPPIASDTQVAAAPQMAAPLPPRRPVDLGVAPAPSAAPSAAANPTIASQDAASTASAPGFFAKLFSGIHVPQGQQVAAYAAPETSTLSRSSSQNPILRSVAPWSSAPSGLSRYDKFTAVYDIEARTVYLPDGRRLEAHSGLGDLKDDPKHVDAHVKGATPPDVYELAAREGLFHGVQALRLKPVGSGEQFGRTGLLAHPYMLGPDGDSFGCVSFKDYDAFLSAYQSGQVKKLVVVSKLD